MTRTAVRFSLSLMVLTALGTCSPAAAQVLGAFKWQMQPYCNVVTFTVIQQGTAYQLAGSDNLCGAPAVAPATGAATPNPDGTISLGFDVVLPSGATAHVSANVNLSTISGTWSDADGNTGPFVFNPPGVAGPPRPEPARSVLITSVQLASSIFAGTGSAATIARSDHTHDDRYYTQAQTVAIFEAAVVESTAAVQANLTPEFVSDTQTVTTPKAGRLLISFPANVKLFCNPASFFYAFLTVDGTPVPNSVVNVDPGEPVQHLTGITTAAVPAGPHTIRVATRCGVGSWVSASHFSHRVSVVVLP